MTNAAPITLAQLFRFWRALPHQSAAISELEDDLKANGYVIAMRRDRDWFRTWSTDGKQNGDRAPTAEQPVTESRNPNPLPVPYFAQLDSATDQARRMCFSSSCAMLLAFLRPGILHGPNGDDQYLARVQAFGDTTSAIAQVQALGSYEVQADFTKQADFATLQRSIDAGIPVPCGYLHRGPKHAPAGGGHWLIVVGYTKTHVIVHDPLGEADLVSGATLPKPAKFCQYSKENFGRRWMVEGSGSGWAIVVRR